MRELSAGSKEVSSYAMVMLLFVTVARIRDPFVLQLPACSLTCVSALRTRLDRSSQEASRLLVSMLAAAPPLATELGELLDALGES